MQQGMSINIYTLYGAALKGCSEEMRRFSGPLTRMGLKAVGHVLAAFLREFRRHPRAVWKLMREGLFRCMRGLETLGENSWCFLAGFYLAELCRRDGIELIHSPWSNGPGTAAWIASRLTGIPFALTGRAGDIYPPDGVLAEKLRDSLFVRTNNKANVRYLAEQCPPGQGDKVRLVYNSLTLNRRGESAVSMRPPYNLLAVGRFARTKGFDVLLTAMARLRREGFPCHLTLIGDGWQHWHLHSLRQRLRLENAVDMPGFVPHDQIMHHMLTHDMLLVPSVVHETGDRDGIPNVIMEALSNRLPVIATDVCGIGEVIQDGKTGLLIPQRDPRALADAVRRMARDRKAAVRMADNGRALVERMFDGKTNIRALRDLYVSCYETWKAARYHGERS